MPEGLGFMVQAIFGIMGSQILLHLGRGTVCTVKWRVSRCNCCMFCEVQLSLVVVSIVVLLLALNLNIQLRNMT